MEYIEPSPLKISIHTITCNIGVEIKLYQLSRLLNIYDENSISNKDVFNDELGNFLSINNYSEEKKQFTDFPRGRMKNRLPSQVFNNQITLIYKYHGFKEVNVKIFTNGELHMTGIKDVKYESKHISNHLIKILKSSKYQVWITKYFTKLEKNKDFIVYYNSRNKKLEYYRRNLSKYCIENILTYNKKSGKSTIITTTNTYDNLLNSNDWLSIKEIKIWFDKNVKVANKHIDSINKLKDYLLCQDKFNDIDKYNIHNFLIKFKNIIPPIKEFNTIEDKAYKPMLKVKLNKIMKWLKYYVDYITKIIDTDNLFVKEINDKYIDSIIKQYNKNKTTKQDKLKFLEFENDFEKLKYKFGSLEIVNINCDFTTNFINYLDMIKEILENKYDIYSTYNPDKKYPGILIKFKYNDLYTDTSKYSPGVCYCDEPCINKQVPDCHYITISIFRPGSTMITGCRNIKQIMFVYSFIKSFIKDNFNYVCDNNPKNVDELKINENKKILRKKQLYYLKKASIKY